MDPVSQLPQAKLDGNKLKIRNTNGARHSTFLGLAVVILVIAGVIGGGYVLLTRKSPASGGEEPSPTVDTRPLTVEVVKPVREVTNPSTEVTVIANKPITLEQHNRASLQEVGQKDGQYYYIVRVVNLPVDKQEVLLKMNDAVGNHAEQKLEITRKVYAFPPGYTQILPWENAEYVLDGDDLGVIVDKTHRLFEDYEPADIVDLNKTFGLYTLNNSTLTREAGNALKAMLDKMAEETGKYVTIASGYRSYEEQVRRYSSLLRELGEAQANTLSSKPGHSEHQLGTAVDLVSDETGWKITNDFGNTPAGQWLAANCAKYGFVQGNSASDEKISGAWLFRYIGIVN